MVYYSTVWLDINANDCLFVQICYHLTPASNRCLVYATLVRTSFGINFRPFLNML